MSPSLPKDIADIVQGLYAQRDLSYGPLMLVDMEEGRRTDGEHTIGDLVERAACTVLPRPS